MSTKQPPAIFSAMRLKGIKPALDKAVYLGLTPSACLENTGISLEDLTAADEQHKGIRLEQEFTFYENILSLSDSPYIGLELGTAYQIETLGVLGYAQMTAKTLEDSIKIATNYSPLTLSYFKPVMIKQELSGGLALAKQYEIPEQLLQIFSDRARPFVKNFDFIKGFEGGKLEYESTISKKGSNSNLLITDFKVSKVPALAKLLTLASLQGIADTLSGEGIRFESFEMKSNSEGNVLNIEDALAMGPAISILLEGYVDKGKIVSLRGTLVPATTLNKIIGSIPILGNILVGKKGREAHWVSATTK